MLHTFYLAEHMLPIVNIRCKLMGPLNVREMPVFFSKLVGFNVNVVGNLVGISGIGCQISGIEW